MTDTVTIKHPASLAPPWLLYLFTFAFIIQFAHSLEHVVQAYQHAILRIDVFHSHGILFFFDEEVVHAVLNAAIFATLVTVAITLGLYRRNVRRSLPTVFVAVLLCTCALEAWHVTEHMVRLYQHFTTGCQPCNGVLGNYVDLIYLHCFYNVTVTTGALFVYFRYGFARAFYELL